jgi:hypothetical protein
MTNIKLKLDEVLQLEGEINGFANPENGTVIFEGFLKQNLSIILKYELNELNETLLKHRKNADNLRNELIQKHGEYDSKTNNLRVIKFNEVRDDEGNIISKVLNPKFVEFDKEYGSLLDKEIELSVPEITLDDLKDIGKVKDDYKILFKLIKK